jgi:hypothetical protein
MKLETWYARGDDVMCEIEKVMMNGWSELVAYILGTSTLWYMYVVWQHTKHSHMLFLFESYLWEKKNKNTEDWRNWVTAPRAHSTIGKELNKTQVAQGATRFKWECFISSQDCSSPSWVCGFRTNLLPRVVLASNRDLPFPLAYKLQKLGQNSYTAFLR